VVKIQAEAVIPDADSPEPCRESKTLRWLSELPNLADAGDVDARRSSPPAGEYDLAMECLP
jgi:hypothetical protein